MIPVSSSNMVAVGYNSSNQELTVQFHNGVYTHTGVPHYIYEGLLSSSSKGSYYHQNIKRYPFRRGY
ncbi:TPA: KTSC domain-containing protein [Enterococcus faecalis]|nr:KTSC domain-containing protein [Enterococcus faecalis]HAP5211268.1 KTSC domain-containing protein [Enterococcus faecalis]HAP5301710.1 KTSC domain-containing protein [Enterococcus faecalis]HAP5359201.1 KTSC domain-containing protein [Enterococcus faecalis]HAP5421257.1 KTSC domain-containing protein [Enterococcus faecalis]HAP5449390.1 KTSC domain-containing protein [Enterococcus faecalis]